MIGPPQPSEVVELRVVALDAFLGPSVPAGVRRAGVSAHYDDVFRCWSALHRGNVIEGPAVSIRSKVTFEALLRENVVEELTRF